MFENERVHTDSPVDRMDLGDDAPAEQPDNPLDSPEMDDLHTRLMGFYVQELDRQGENRFQQAVEEDYFDNIQWTEEEARVLKDRGQAPLVYNVIATSVNWIIGSEKRGRTDFNVLPRNKEEGKSAELKTKLLKYLSDVNRTQFHRSRAFEDAVKVGIGWLEDGAQDDDDGETVYSRYESWRNMLWDSASIEYDLSDARYVFRVKWTDIDIAKAYFPKRTEKITNAVTTGSRYGGALGEDIGDDAMDSAEYDRQEHGYSRTLVSNLRDRVRLIECWYRTPMPVQRLYSDKYRGEVYDESHPGHVEDVSSGRGVLIDRISMRVRCAIFTSAGLLWEGASPYRHNRFPFTPVWGYKRGRDGLPYGVIRYMRDIQDDINKRASKALHILSTNKVIMDEGAVEDMDEFIDEVSRPDAVIVKKQGKSIELNVDRELAPAHLELLSRNIQMVQQIGGVTDELMGRSTNAVSGVAIQARQEQGSVSTNKLFDNLRLAVQIQGETQLSLIEQFFTEQKDFRITNMRGTPDFVSVNDGLPENDIVRTKADFVISESDWRASMRAAAAEQLSELIAKMPPQIGLVLLDLLVESMDLPNRDAIVDRIRQVNGQSDPDATEPDPKQAAQQAAQQKAQDQQDRMTEAEIAEKQARADKLAADTAKVQSATILDKVNASLAAEQAAEIAIVAPATAMVADNILKEAGWSAPGAGIIPQQSAQPPMPPQMPPQQPGGAAMVPNGAAPNDVNQLQGLPQQ
ncbi:portal protein [Caballeronia zhejiangensis]|uniref:Portal protein n=1 Tax=Caballeronia zhejiangensis TaxID=871203 RepID=A0A656QC29_9BURK|nr:portal protein [Caballeronia zhejiangensis]KDR25954.1 hypothetical protein BG60_26430 [Caballeronia zhejiangensis]